MGNGVDWLTVTTCWQEMLGAIDLGDSGFKLTSFGFDL